MERRKIEIGMDTVRRRMRRCRNALEIVENRQGRSTTDIDEGKGERGTHGAFICTQQGSTDPKPREKGGEMMRRVNRFIEEGDST